MLPRWPKTYARGRGRRASRARRPSERRLRSTPTPSDARTSTTAPAGAHASSTRAARKRAGARFWVVFVLLVAAFVLLAMTTWREIGRLFGL